MKRVLCVFLLFCLLIVSVPMVSAQEPSLPDYDPYAAAAYAEAHWNDRIGQCAQFVNRCLTAGGLVVPNDPNYYKSWEPRYWGSYLGVYTNPYICSGALLKYLSGFYPIIKDPTIYEMTIGDVIFMSASGNLDGHTGIITGFQGEVPLYTAHNADCHNRPVTFQHVNFVAKVAPNVLCDKEQDCAANVFRDMPRPGFWSHEPIDFVYNNNLFNGVSDSAFSPNETMTRGMLVTVLWRLAGSEQGDFPCPFDDVPQGSWYELQIGWAAQNGIVEGCGKNRFAPNDPLTREQMAAILLRFTSQYHTDSGLRTDFAQFADGDEVSAWATDSMQWAISQDILRGASSKGRLWLFPCNSIIRAEVAAMLMRYCGVIASEQPEAE